MQKRPEPQTGADQPRSAQADWWPQGQAWAVARRAG